MDLLRDILVDPLLQGIAAFLGIIALVTAAIFTIFPELRPKILGFLEGSLKYWIVVIAAIFVVYIGYTNGLQIETLALIAGVMWVICGYVTLKRKGSFSPISSRGRTSDWQYPRWRPWAKIGLLLIPILVGAVFAIQRYQDSQSSEDFIVLVADFHGRDTQDYRVTDIIINRLRSELDPYPNVKIQALGKPILSTEGSEQARALGYDEGASIVIWGWYGATSEAVTLSVNFETLCELACSPDLRSEV